MDGEFCVVCARTDVPLTDGECAECFSKRVPLVTAPERPIRVVCPTCGSRLIRAHWEPTDAGERLTSEDLVPLLVPHPEVAIRRVQWTETGGNRMQRDVEGAVELSFRGLELVRSVKMVVRTEHMTCPTCSRKSGRYYTAIIQLRATLDGPNESAVDRRARLQATWDALFPEMRRPWREALSWKEPLPEGWDVYVTDTLAARAIARLIKARLGADLKETATLWGRKDGHDVYRVTLRLRIAAPPAAPGSARARPVQRHA
ncbi:MAG: 60S ribosomal export protein NMD3 [Thermoplasmata archaeon]|nr:60S ribosomal export protein NMD3 [Thermoplasmata archaeon]